MEESDLKALLQQDAAISSYVSSDELDDAIDDALDDTGWAFPITDTFKIRWIKQRSKRHCFFKLMTSSARKFKVEAISMNQRFDQYSKVVDKMDAEFKDILDERPEMFSTVDTYKMFGTVAPAGFIYDITGKDVTDY